MNKTQTRSFRVSIGAALAVAATSSIACNIGTAPVNATAEIPIITWLDALRAYLGPQIKLAVARGSYTSASFVMTTQNGSSCNKLEISVTNLSHISQQEKSISSSDIKINYVQRWFQGGSAWTGIAPDKSKKLTPELLVNDPTLVKLDITHQKNFLKISKNQKATYVDTSKPNTLSGGSLMPAVADFNVKDSDTLQPLSLSNDIQQVWLKVKPPADTEAGEYRGKIRIHNAGALVSEVPIVVTIYPFNLPAPSIEYSIYYRGKLFSRGATISSDYKDDTQFMAELLDMKEHGITNPTMYQETSNWALVDRALSLRKKAGFNSPNLYYVGLSAASSVQSLTESEFASKIEKLQALASNYGYNSLHLYGIDEAKGEEQRKQLPSWQVVRKKSAKVFAAGKTGTFDNVGSNLDLLILAYKPDSAEVSKFHKASKRIFTYAFPQTGPENPYIFRRNYGIELWKSGVDGAMPYAYMHSFGSSWNDFDSAKYRDHHFVYPTANGVIDTIAWEGFHEGIEDVRYLTALEETIKKVKTICSNNSGCQGTISNAENTLEDLRAEKNTNDLNAMRENIAAHILALQKYTGALEPPSAPTIRTQGNN